MTEYYFTHILIFYFHKQLFETFNMLFMYIKSLLSILFHADNKMGCLIFDTPHKRCI